MIAIANEAKNSISITNEAKGNSLTWDQDTKTFDENTGTWDVPGEVISLEIKNTINITNETKN